MMGYIVVIFIPCSVLTTLYLLCFCRKTEVQGEEMQTPYCKFFFKVHACCCWTYLIITEVYIKHKMLSIETILSAYMYIYAGCCWTYLIIFKLFIKWKILYIKTILSTYLYTHTHTHTHTRTHACTYTQCLFNAELFLERYWWGLYVWRGTGGDCVWRGTGGDRDPRRWEGERELHPTLHCHYQNDFA